MDSHEITADGAATAERRIFFFVKIGFSPINSSNSARKSINFLYQITKSILTSYIGSKKQQKFGLSKNPSCYRRLISHLKILTYVEL
jgi:hypothetical protein